MSVDVSETNPLLPRRRRRRVPRRFFLGTLGLYAIVLGTFLLWRTSLRTAIPNWRTVVPTFAAVSFYITATLFLLILGRGRVSRWVVLSAVATTFVLTVTVCLVLRSQNLYDAIDPGFTRLRGFVAAVTAFRRRAFESETLGAEWTRFALMPMLEEAIKLVPVFLLIAIGRIRTAHGAMLCGVLCGLTFGNVEAASFGYLIYPPAHEPVTSYFTRFFVMSPLHGIWDALAGGLVFYLSGRWRSNAMRSPGWTAYLAAYSCAVLFHVLHNAVQARWGAQMQIVSVFALLAPLYVMAKDARRRALAAGETPDTRVMGDLHMLTLALATWFIGSSVLFASAMGLGDS